MGPKAAPISVWTIEQLLLDSEKRGIDATGVAVQTDKGVISIVKGASPAWQFVKTRAWTDFLDKHSDRVVFKDDIRTILCHTRAQSVGGSWKNENNHPVTAGKSAITHNGGIRNHEWVFKNLNLKRNAEVDSDVIRAILDEKGLTPEGLKALNTLSGPAAIAAVSPEYPDRLLLARSGSPLSVAAFLEAGHMLWASRKESIHRVARYWYNVWGLEMQRNRADLVFNPVPHEYVFVWEGEKLILRGPFNSNSGAKHELNYTCHVGYKDKTKDNREKAAKAELAEKQAVGVALEVKPKPEFVTCPGRCGAIISFEGLENEPLEALGCPNCGHTLAGVVE